MPDFNHTLEDIQKRSSKIERDLKELLISYEGLHKEANHEFIGERIKNAGSMDGLEPFYRLVNTLKRNRDVVASMMRAAKGIRSLKDFKFIEEEIEKTKIDEEKIEQLEIPQEQVVHVPETTEAIIETGEKVNA